MTAAVHGRAKLVGDRLTITAETQTRGLVTETYAVARLEPHASVARAAFRLTKLAGGAPSERYDVREDSYGLSCDCADYLWRRDGTGLGCKHIQAALAVGLLTGR